MTSAGLTVIFPIVGIVFIIFLSCAIWSSRYTKVGPNQVLIISGRQYLHQNADGTVSQRGFRIVKSGGSFVFPVLEKVDVLNLEPVTMEFQFADIGINGIAQVKISGDDSSITKAAEHFLNKSADAIRASAMQIVESHCRKTVGSVKIEHQVAQDLAAMGLSLVSFVFRSFDPTALESTTTGKPPLSVTT